MQTSKAAEIPEELFEHVVWHACDAGGESPLQQAAKPLVVACASVCRYWARLARRELFRCLTLRTLDDVHRLRAILDAPTLPDLDPVAALIRRLDAAPDNRDTPWLHLVFLRTLAALPADVAVCVHTRPSDGRPWRSLHPALPRTLPGSTMAPFEELDVSGVRFPDARTLARLLGSLPKLAMLIGTSPTFGAPPTAADLAIPPFGLQLYSVTFDDQALCHAFVPRLLANAAPAGPPARIRAGRVAKQILADDDLAAAGELFALFGSAPSIGVMHYYGAPFSTGQATSVLKVSPYEQDGAEFGQLVAPELELYLDSGMDRRTFMHTGPAAAPAGPAVLYVRTVQVLLVRILDPRAEKVCSETLWDSFCKTLLKFKYLQRVEVVRNWASRDDGWSAAIGLTDEAFKPLIERKKFGCRFLNDDLGTVWLQPTMSGKGKEKGKQ